MRWQSVGILISALLLGAVIEKSLKALRDMDTRQSSEGYAWGIALPD